MHASDQAWAPGWRGMGGGKGEGLLLVYAETPTPEGVGGNFEVRNKDGGKVNITVWPWSFWQGLALVEKWHVLVIFCRRLQKVALRRALFIHKQAHRMFSLFVCEIEHITQRQLNVLCA